MQRVALITKHHVEVVPGNVEAHYQPNPPLRILSSKQLLTSQ
jgi:L-threonylcarbamoyladenylate synthase